MSDDDKPNPYSGFARSLRTEADEPGKPIDLDPKGHFQIWLKVEGELNKLCTALLREANQLFVVSGPTDDRVRPANTTPPLVLGRMNKELWLCLSADLELHETSKDSYGWTGRGKVEGAEDVVKVAQSWVKQQLGKC